MRNELPDNHGLDARVMQSLVHQQNGRPSITDVQYEALSAGVGRGESVLVVSPTSTGKTQIALWAMAARILQGGRVVYLVTHRALARQKFDEFLASHLSRLIDNDLSRIVVATGDYVLGGDGLPPKNPLQADLLVATYEKYLGLLSGGGVPSALSDVTIVCDEIQLIGDAHRGQSVEVLLTLLRNAGWGQLIGLSAVISNKDASEFADWLGVGLVLMSKREKHLRYECWTGSGMSVVSTDRVGFILDNQIKPIQSNQCIDIVRWLLTQSSVKPVIVFCMKKADTTRLAQALVESGSVSQQEQLSFEFLDMPETSAATLLRNSLTRRVAIHNADLTDEERAEVEKSLLEGRVDVVFSTSSLAAGVNFPLGTAVFCSWTRWDGDLRRYVPIDQSEFHNMAGRVGRMGFEHQEGKVIFCADNTRDVSISRKYLELDRVEGIESRIDPTHFPILVLQLIASGICSTAEGINKLVSQTFSGLREADRNATAFSKWPERMAQALSRLVVDGMVNVRFDGKLSATPFGIAAAHTGLQPDTCSFLLSNVSRLSQTLASWLPSAESAGRIDDLLFTISRICFSCPEFSGGENSRQTRFFPWPIKNEYISGVNQRLMRFHDRELSSIPEVLNSAAIACDWAQGAAIVELEMRADALSAGMIRDHLRNLAWVMQGLSALLVIASDSRVPYELRPAVLQSQTVDLNLLARLPRFIGILIRRVNEGLPVEVVWMLELNAWRELFRLSREDILRLRSMSFYTPLQLMAGDQAADEARILAFSSARPSPKAKANWIRDSARAWKSVQRKRSSEKQVKRASRCSSVELLKNYYSSTGTIFEAAFEACLSHLQIDWVRLDDRSRTGAPDYLLRLVENNPIVFELKTKESEKLVDYNRAVEVLAASEVHGYREAFCVTLCHPGVDPSVPGVVASCGRLSVIESHDLAEALLRICEGDLTLQQFHHWLSVPGQATAMDLPYRERAQILKGP
jgi:helicase